MLTNELKWKLKKKKRIEIEINSPCSLKPEKKNLQSHSIKVFGNFVMKQIRFLEFQTCSDGSVRTLTFVCKVTERRQN